MTKLFCDRCGRHIPGNYAITLTLEVVNQERKRIDLCMDCAQGFEDFCTRPGMVDPHSKEKPLDV